MFSIVKIKIYDYYKKFLLGQFQIDLSSDGRTVPMILVRHRQHSDAAPSQRTHCQSCRFIKAEDVCFVGDFTTRLFNQ